MTLTLTDKSQFMDYRECQTCEQRLYDALYRYHSMIQSIEVTIKPVHSQIGTEDKSYRVRIQHTSGEIIFKYRTDDLSDCVDEICERARKAVSRARVRYLTRLSGEV